ncbi:hypothetical protein DEU56DRAFT_911260 [Suillus clintonianus]|uniref:uncharacterized protein n=1 Tax=Suillus clintonianus TaxID=1904413 RepID=UPI001B873D0C|nr:uncharacterized protein DEU56DRAFT_911260 [Suillus clintonianus]KAG2141924.1 hypothetical protein DEU56DRAFT_911260 [Suillus clintonianus]
MHTPKSQVNFLPASDVISALQNILAHSQVIIPDLETPYSQPELRSTNYFAVKFKDQSISTIVTERHQQLNAILVEISNLKTVSGSIKKLHRQLIKQKDNIIKSINLHNRLRSALWRLPTEILSRIFHLCLPDVPRLDKLQPLSQLTAPTLLTRICRGWREVAMGIPSLWCRLSRSRGLPLSLAFDCFENNSTKLRSLLRPYMNQISSLYVSQGAEQLELLFKDLPALQELTIISSRHWSPTERCISRLPSTLSGVTFLGMWFNLAFLSSFAPIWAHLMKLEIYVDQRDAFNHLLQLCPNLSSLTIAVGTVSPQIQALEPFTHTKLRFLRIPTAIWPRNKIFNVLDGLSLPNLRTLDVRSAPTWPHKDIKAFLGRSKCPLETLVLEARMMLTDWQLAECVALIPSFNVVVS